MFFAPKRNLTTSLNNNPHAVPDGQGHVGQQQADLRGAGRPALQVDGDDAGHEDRQAGLPRTDQARQDRRGAPGGAQVPQEGLFLLVRRYSNFFSDPTSKPSRKCTTYIPVCTVPG